MHAADLRRLVHLTVLGLLAALPAARAEHPAITLLDEDMNIINPISGENADAPFSTQQTCGLCHEYDTITQGYHFQMGWNVIADDYGVKEGRPWSLSNGFMGRWYPYAYRQLAKKHNTTADEMDLTVYDWVGFSSPGPGEPPCGACHPGGGGLVKDRDGHRYDSYLAEHPELTKEFDGDYYKSNWVASGVVEADCLICHLANYNYDNRVDQLRQGNYRWAVVAGSGIGLVDGAVSRGQTPKVRYETRLFNVDGTISLKMSWPPPNDNCMFCHGTSDEKKRGFSWNDIFNPDIHNQQGISCAACHPAQLDHQIAKGDPPELHGAPAYDNTMKKCADCHFSGYLGAPIPRHVAVRTSHLDRVACQSCHIPELHRVAAQGVDMTTGTQLFSYRPPGSKKVGERGAWEPNPQTAGYPQISPVNPVQAVYWGNRTRDGVVWPLFLREQAAAWPLFAGDVTDDNGDGHKEVNRPEEITAGLRGVAKSLQGNQRFDQIHPVFLKAGTAWELDGSGQLVQSPLAGTALAGATEVDFSIDHNVAPTRSTLGAEGCLQCHGTSAFFFKGHRVVDLFGADGAPVTRDNGAFFGCKPWSFAINSIHQQIIAPYTGPSIMIVVFLIVLHYHSYGPKRIVFDPYSQEIQRFTIVERSVHLIRLIAFVILAVTGLILAFNLRLWQELLVGPPKRLHDIHVAAGFTFIVTMVLGIWLWFRDALFASYDKVWVRKLGGYLGYKGAVPAGRFNAGQKMFYWYTAIFGAIMSFTGVILVFRNDIGLPTVCATSTFHNLVGFFLIAGVVAHAYLGTVANPGTWRVLVDGSVTREWARHHHPNWYRVLLERGIIQPDDEDRREAADEEQHGSGDAD